MTTEARAMVIDPDDEQIPARARVIGQIVDTLQEAHDDWLAEVDSESSITLITRLGKFTLVVVEERA